MEGCVNSQDEGREDAGSVKHNCVEKQHSHVKQGAQRKSDVESTIL